MVNGPVDTALVEHGERSWRVGNAIAISFLHLTAGWRFWAFWNDGNDPDEVGDYGDLRTAHEAATAAILADPDRAADSAAMRAARRRPGR